MASPGAATSKRLGSFLACLVSYWWRRLELPCLFSPAVQYSDGLSTWKKYKLFPVLRFFFVWIFTRVPFTFSKFAQIFKFRLMVRGKNFIRRRDVWAETWAVDRRNRAVFFLPEKKTKAEVLNFNKGIMRRRHKEKLREWNATPKSNS